MSDRSASKIQIGGRLPVSKVEELVDLITAQGAGENWEGGFDSVKDAEEWIRKADWDKTYLELVDNEACGGEMDDIEAFCRENKLTYCMHSSACLGAYDCSIVFWRPGWKQRTTFDSNEDYEVLVRLDVLDRALKEDPQMSLRKMVQRLRRRSPEIPPLQLIDEASPERAVQLHASPHPDTRLVQNRRLQGGCERAV